MQPTSSDTLKMVQSVLHRYAEENKIQLSVLNRGSDVEQKEEEEEEEEEEDDEEEEEEEEDDEEEGSKREAKSIEKRQRERPNPENILRPTKHVKTAAELFPLRCPSGYKPDVMFNKAEFAYWKIWIHDASVKPWPQFSEGLWNDENICSPEQPDTEWGFCVCFGDAEVDQKLNITNSYCIALRHTRKEDSTKLFRYLKAGSLDDLKEDTKTFIVDQSFDFIHIRKLKATDVIGTASIDLKPYHG